MVNSTSRHALIMMISSIIALTAIGGIAQAQPKKPVDVWEPLRFLIGEWEGTGTGKPGVSRVERTYRFALNEKYIEVRNRSIYDPQEKNPKGERHEDWALISYDKARKRFVMRQFNVEGYVIHYVSEDSRVEKTFVFQSESIENIPAGYRSRETYKIISADEIVEVFELAGPGKEFEVYTENRLKRKK